MHVVLLGKYIKVLFFEAKRLGRVGDHQSLLFIKGCTGEDE